MEMPCPGHYALISLSFTVLFFFARNVIRLKRSELTEEKCKNHKPCLE
jgi:hypothetical protein